MSVPLYVAAQKYVQKYFFIKEDDLIASFSGHAEAVDVLLKYNADPELVFGEY